MNTRLSSLLAGWIPLIIKSTPSTAFLTPLHKSLVKRVTRIPPKLSSFLVTMSESPHNNDKVPSSSPLPKPTLEEPAKKKAKTSNSSTSNNAAQSNLSSFFQPVATKKKAVSQAISTESSSNDDATKNKKKEENDDNDGDKNKKENIKTDNAGDKNGDTTSNNNNNNNSKKSLDPIVPNLVPTPRNAVYQSLHDNMVIIRKPTNDKEPRTKVAAFDMDGTLFVWTCASWPSQLTHYELWCSDIPAKLRALYDDGYKLLLISNQGGIQKAHSGKKAQLVQSIMNFLAHLIDRPVHAVMSTKSPKKEPQKSFHKPAPKLWQVAIQYLNKNTEFDVANSFFVGDSADPNDEQGGVDYRFAQNVSEKYGSTLKFYTPQEYFGPSSSEQRQRVQGITTEAPPKEALQTRSALLGGNLNGPILLILCGVQGSGKSTFCQELLGVPEKNGKDGNTESDTDEKPHWVHLSQDTIHNGKPGKREKVEALAKAALENGQSVVVDRMHLTVEQRGYFVQVAQEAGVPAHAVLLNPNKELIAQRVRERTNHPGKVQGEDGAKRALQSLATLVVPKYKEGLGLISCASTVDGVSRLAQLYGCVGNTACPPAPTSVTISENVSIPAIALGTMKVGKKVTKDVVTTAVQVGVRAIDTAPTYKNEDRVGDALVEMGKSSAKMFVIAKIPKAASEPSQVRTHLNETLEKLQQSSVDLLLLHWPCDVIAAGTLESVWKEMEDCCKEGKCKALGVCNFNVNSLAMLLASCSIPPTVNQVERHPLLAQMDLVDFCASNNILLQAHTPLGQGSSDLLANEKVNEVAKARSMTPAQVVLQWNLQQGMLVVPKFSTEDHARELTSIRPLSSEDMQLLDSLDQGKRFVAPPFMFGNKPYCWSK